ncbi:MAG: transposase [Chloroflexi bacterium]|nr:transposase [Chloroflexota bacterium]
MLLYITVSVHYCARCDHYFRAAPPFLSRRAIYTHRVVDKAVRSVYEDGMAMRRVSERLARDFWVRPSEGRIRQWCRAYGQTFDFTTDYQPWVVSQFSGILCVDEVYQDQLALLLAVDPAAPDGDRLVGYQLLHGAVDAAAVERFLRQLRAAGIDPAEVITDGSELYPAVLAQVWPQAAHQLCLFHETRHVTRTVLKAIQAVRHDLPLPPPAPGVRGGGVLRQRPPSADPQDPATHQWYWRQAYRHAAITQVHELAQQGHSRRAIARQTGHHRTTIKSWLQQPIPPLPADLPADIATGAALRGSPNRTSAPTEAPPLVDTGVSATRACSGERPDQLSAEWRPTTSPVVAPLTASAPAAESAPMGAVAAPAPANEEPVADPGALAATPDSTEHETAAARPVAVENSGRPAEHPTAPPAPWTSWAEVRQVREALQEHRFLLLHRPERLSPEEQVQVTALLDSPIGTTLQAIYAFLTDWYQLWTDDAGQRRTWADAQTRYEAWRTDMTYSTVPALRRAQERMTAAKFEHLAQFLRHSEWEATNNGAERAGRAFRHRQGPHFNLRKPESIQRSIDVTAGLRKEAATRPLLEPLHTCQRGRQRRRQANAPPGGVVP